MYKQTDIKLETSSVPNEVFCTGCMSSDRILRRLDDLTEIFARITEDIIEVNKNIMLCWECVALLRRVKTFRKNVSAVQRLLSYYYDYENPPQTLSKLTIQHFDTENLIETKPSVEETYLTNEGENNRIEGMHTLIEGKYPSIEGKDTSNEGKYPSIEGKNTSNEGRYSLNEGNDTSDEGKYPSIEDKITSNEGKYSLIEGITPTVVQVKEETDCMDDIFNDGCSIDFGIELKDVQDITRNRNCLDHVLLRTNRTAHCYVAHTSVTDHDSVLLFLDSTHNSSKPNSYKIIKQLDYDKIETDLKTFDFSRMYNMKCVNEATNYFIDSLSNLINTNYILKSVPNRKRQIKPWMTAGLLKCMRNRDQLHIKYKKSPYNEIIKTTYKRYRNYCTLLLRKSKHNYEKSLINSAQKNPKKLWDAVKTITNTKKQKSSANELLSGVDPMSSVNEANNFFVSVGRKLAESIDKGSTDRQQHRSSYDPPSVNSFFLAPTDEAETEQIVAGLRSECAIGLDGISGSFLKRFKSTLVPPITFICNLSFETGVFPSAFKVAIVYPIHKTGDKKTVNNYRPISILPALSKVLEKILNRRLVKYLNLHNLLSSSQYGFRTGISTNDAVLALTNEIVTKLDKKNKVIGIFLDLAKAFDTVCVTKLLTKLEHMGIRDTQLNLFRSYLMDRRQCVKIKDWLQHLVKPKKKRNFQSNNLPLYRLIKLPKRQCVIVKRKIEQSEINYWLEQDRNSPYYRAASAKCESCAKVLVGSCRRGHAKSKHDIKKYTDPHICDICQSIYSMKSSLAKHIKDHYYIYVCTTCDFSCASINNMKSHVKVQAKRRLYYCLECPGVFTIRKLFYKHYKEEHTLFICDHCNTQFKCKSRLIRHITLQHSSGVCTICNIDFKLYRYLRAHMRRIHEYAPSEANYCATCDRQYSNDQRFKVHIMNSIAHSKERRARKREEKVQCPECPKIYQRRSFMMNHYRLVHLKKTNYYCTICEKYFLTSTRLKQHTREKHEGLGPVKNKLCYLCGRGFAIPKNDEIPYCAECDKHFATIISYKAHVKTVLVHNNSGKDFKYQCDHCKKKFATKWHLRQHIADRHLKIQNFQCNMCAQKFTTKKRLRIHRLKQHEGYVSPKDKVCEFCSKVFASLSTMRDHLNMHKGLRPYVCNICGNSFSFKAALFTHRRLKHKIPRLKDLVKEKKNKTENVDIDTPLDQNESPNTNTSQNSNSNLNMEL